MSETTTEKIVYLVRHGQSVANVSPVFQGPDSPLNELGEAQAESMAQRMAGVSFESLIASPVSRAKATAEAIAKAAGKSVEFSELFVERMKPTSINGKSHTDPEASAIAEEWEKSLVTPGMRVEDGENFDAIVHRADRALDFLLKRPEKSLVVVTHGYFLRTIVARVLLGHVLTSEVFKTFHGHASHENTGITVLRYRRREDGKAYWQLWIYNDHAHLG